MGYRNREVEKKYVVEKTTMKITIENMRELLGPVVDVLQNGSKDFYWRTPKGCNADFIRLRNMPDGSAQLTVKHADKIGNTNRVEIDVEITKEQVPQTAKFLDQVFGKTNGSVYKEYYVFFLDDKDTTVSVYRVRGDKRVFVELEARNLDGVNKLEKLIGEKVILKYEPRSLYQIFIKDN
jgi:adenylate cyclase class IV